MSQDIYEVMGQGFPALTDLIIDINVHSGAFGQERIAGTLAQFVQENSVERLQRAIQDIDKACQNLPMDHKQFARLMNHVLESDDEVLALLGKLRQGLQDGLAAKSKSAGQDHR